MESTTGNTVRTVRAVRGDPIVCTRVCLELNEASYQVSSRHIILVPTSNGKRRSTTPHYKVPGELKKRISFQEDDAVSCKRIKTRLPYFVYSTGIHSAI